MLLRHFKFAREKKACLITFACFNPSYNCLFFKLYKKWALKYLILFFSGFYIRMLFWFIKSIIFSFWFLKLMIIHLYKPLFWNLYNSWQDLIQVFYNFWVHQIILNSNITLNVAASDAIFIELTFFLMVFRIKFWGIKLNFPFLENPLLVFF